MNDLEGRVCEIVSGVMGVSREQLNRDSSPDTIRVWDSLRHMNLILALEQEFQVEFSDEELVELLNIGLIVDTLQEKYGVAPGG